MNHPVLSSLLPVVLLITLGFAVGRLRLVRPESTRDLSNVVFLLLAPALLFRSMGGVHVEQLSLRPVAAYFMAAFVIFFGTLWVRGFNRSGAVLTMATTYSNTVMIGVPLIGLAYGEAGMVTLLMLVSIHAMVLLTSSTVAVEIACAREQAARGEGSTNALHILRTLGRALRASVINPVTLPVISGLLFAQTGWAIPSVIDRPLQLLAQSFAPLALMLVGITLAQTRVGHHLRGALAVAASKNLLHPVLVALFAWMLGVTGLPLAVMVVTASLPVGANAFLLAQRYRASEELVTASVVVSTALALVTVSVTMVFVG
ncbi:MAG: AEC family transporter [Burkholderiaceae bacterium]|nr:AEC family transporter [Burkholderiaceae bacterium]MDO9088726.1 AEC family transporter [Burkholderiaceae bacterium]